jgi:hypothetical protein
MAPQQFGLFVLASLGAIALLLTVLGTYVLAETMAVMRTRELGIRAALGATSKSLTIVVLRECIVLVGIGLGVGLPLSYLGANVIRAFLFRVQPLDPATLGAVAALILLLAVATKPASGIARRASRSRRSVALGMSRLDAHSPRRVDRSCTQRAGCDSNAIRRRVRVACAKRSNASVDGRTFPPSSRAIYDCDVPMRRASCAWVSPAAVRASISFPPVVVDHLVVVGSAINDNDRWTCRAEWCARSTRVPARSAGNVIRFRSTHAAYTIRHNCTSPFIARRRINLTR